MVAGLEERVGEPQRYLTEVRKQRPDSDPKLGFPLYSVYVLSHSVVSNSLRPQGL